MREGNVTVGKCRITPIKVGQLGDVRCPFCGRYYSKGCIETKFHFDEAKEEYRPMCIRCFLGAPEIKEMARVGNNEQTLNALVKKWDVDYEKALERKLAINDKRKPLIGKPIETNKRVEF
jgi:hypothetical protein